MKRKKDFNNKMWKRLPYYLVINEIKVEINELKFRIKQRRHSIKKLRIEMQQKCKQ